VPLNAQGSVRLVGTDFINYQIPLQTGTGLTCTIAPAPALATLPKGAELALAKGTTKTGSDPEAADDSLTLIAVLVPGATAPVLDGSQDVLLRLQPATGKPVNVLIPNGHAGGTAKKLIVKDTDGSVIQAISDAPSSQDTPPAPPPTQGGSLIVKKGKKRMTFTFKLKGIETSQLTGPVAVTLGVGSLDASRQVTFTATKKGSKFH